MIKKVFLGNWYTQSLAFAQCYELICVYCGKEVKRALSCIRWEASAASPCVRATASPPQELE